MKQSETQWTKAEEIQVLREFVAQLQPKSYLENILSGLPEYVERQTAADLAIPVVEELAEAERTVVNLRCEKLEAEKELERARQEANDLRSELRDARETITNLHKDLAQAYQQVTDNANEAITLQKLIAQLKAENMELKAKLYDYLVKEERAV